MIPDSSLTAYGAVLGWRERMKSPRPDDLTNGYEVGGIALNDGTQGLNVRQWYARVQKQEDPEAWLLQVGHASLPWQTVLTRSAEVTELDLAWDNNMRVFLAFVQEGQAYIHWYDSVSAGMVTTALDADVRTPRCCVDDKRVSQTSRSDIILSYLRGTDLYYRQQRDRYQTEYLLAEDLGEDAILVCLGMTTEYRLQWQLRFAEVIDLATAADVPFLGDIVADVAGRSGVPLANVDVSELYDDRVQGFKVARETSADAIINTLRGAYLFDSCEVDKRLRFRMRGGSEPVTAITSDDLVEQEGEAFNAERVQEAELLRKISVVYIDPAAGYVTNTQSAERRSGTVNAKSEVTIELPITATADEAATIALRRLKVSWGELHKAKFSLGMPWSQLMPGDIVEHTDKLGRKFRLRLAERGEDGGVIEFAADQDCPWAYGVYATATGVQPLPPVPTYPGNVGDTLVVVLDIPLLADQDDEMGYYLAVAGTESGWSGGVVQVSTDDGATIFAEIEFDAPAGIGETETELLAEISSEYLSQQVLQVSIADPLESVDYESLLRYNNRAAIRRPDGTCEVIQYLTAEQIDDDLYELSGLVRGRYNTEPAAAPAGSRFVILDGYVRFIQIQQWMLGQTLAVRAISAGQNPDDVEWQDVEVADPQSQTEWPVHSVVADRDVSNNVTVSWIGRARLGVETSPRHSKYFSGYRVVYSDGYTAETLSQTHVRTSAPPAVTVQVAPINSITGLGPLSESVPT